MATELHPRGHGLSTSSASILWCSLSVLSLVVLYRDMIGTLVAGLLDPWLINDDVRQHLSPLLRCADPELFPGDRIMDYYLEAVHPLLFKAIYCLSAKLGIDPGVTSAVLSVLSLLLVTGAMGWTAYRLAGLPAAWATMALTLGTSVVLERLIGGLERSFAFPILALTCALLAAGRLGWLSLVVVVGAGLYPPAAFVAGVALALALLCPPALNLGVRVVGPLSSMRRRVAALVAVALAAMLVMVPTVAGGSKWGPQLKPDDQVTYPEVGPGGRYSMEDQFGSWKSLAEITQIMRQSVRGTAPGWLDRGDPGIASVIVVSLGAWFLIARRLEAARRVTLLPIAAVLCALASIVFAPYVYIPQRFVGYPLPLFVLLVLGTSLPEAVGRVFADRRRGVVAWMCAVTIVGLVGGRGDALRGFTVDYSEEANLLQFIRTLPKETLLAGWPGGSIDVVPWAARRSALVTYESHEVFHEKYVLEMRTRMRALIDAFYSSDVRALVRLRDEMGVDYLIVDPSRVYGAPAYFKPFDQWIAEGRAVAADRTAEAQDLRESAAVFRDGETYVLDLHRISP